MARTYNTVGAYVYVIRRTDPLAGKAYIGVTKYPLAKRWTQHRHAASKGVRRPLYSSMRKHGIEAFCIEPIAHVDTIDEATAIEAEIIELIGKDDLYNVADGGRVNRGMKYSAERLKSYTEMVHRKYADAEYIKKNRERAVPAMRAAASAPEVEARRIATIKSEGFRARVADGMRRYLSDPANLERHRNARRHRIYHTPLGDFETTTLAAAAWGCTPKTVLDRCNNDVAKWRGWYWTELA